ncbi:hypothetical protein GCK32_009696 [Trichostrongylus colubriformis]|uniref:ZSWIM3 N-terminal domain-containing protein n=1 Tax=Trichostrongylus colubriformis TaxID=6319 RepID=A0AAN8IR34_TRICO
MAAPGKSEQNYGVEMYGFPDFVHIPPKKTHYDTWSTRSSSGCSSSSSPNHLDELHVDIPHSSTASVASTSTASHPSADTTLSISTEAASAPTFADLKPVAPKADTAVLARIPDSAVVSTTALPAEVPQLSAFPSSTQTGLQTTPPGADTPVLVAPVPVRPSPTSATTESNLPQITHDARFSSYAEFEDAFEAWKKKCLHPFRVASSETLREPDGTVNHRFKYRYVVFHCAHYGEPRMRGIGKRPNQHYLPSGCRAMLRLNYSFSEQLLKITTLHDEHLNHEISAEMFRKVSAKLKRSSIGTPSPASKRQKIDSPAQSTYSQDTSLHQPSPLTTSSPLQVSTPTSGANTLAQISLSQSNQMTNMAIALQQQQIMASLLNQQKENINMASGLSSLGLPRPQPSMINILGMMGLQQRLLLQQPAYGLVAPLSQQVSSPPQAQSAPNMEGKPMAMDREAEHRFAAKSDLPAPVPVKPNCGSTQVDGSGSPPHLLPEVPVAAPTPTISLTTSTTTATLANSFEESLARMRSGTQEAELMSRLAQLHSLTTTPLWGAPTIPDFR